MAAYYLLCRRGVKTLFATIGGLYFLGFLISVTSLVLTSLTIHSSIFNKDTLFYVRPHASTVL